MSVIIQCNLFSCSEVTIIKYMNLNHLYIIIRKKMFVSTNLTCKMKMNEQLNKRPHPLHFRILVKFKRKPNAHFPFSQPHPITKKFNKERTNFCFYAIQFQYKAIGHFISYPLSFNYLYESRPLMTHFRLQIIQ